MLRGRRSSTLSILFTLAVSIFSSTLIFGQLTSPGTPGYVNAAPVDPTQMSSPATGALPGARGQEAVRLLKKENLYDSLTTAYQAARYRIEPQEHPQLPRQPEWHSFNPAQDMSADFAADGVHLVASRAGARPHTVALRLASYGYRGEQQSPAIIAPVAKAIASSTIMVL